MNAKRIIMLGTMATAISIGGVWSDKASAQNRLPALKTCGTQLIDENTPRKKTDMFLKALGTTSEEDIYYGLYNGHSLADIATNNLMEVNSIIDLQMNEMVEQLDVRLANGSLSVQSYNDQNAELRGIITRSVYGGRS